MEKEREKKLNKVEKKRIHHSRCPRGAEGLSF